MNANSGPNPLACRVFRNANQAVALCVLVAVTFNGCGGHDNIVREGIAETSVINDVPGNNVVRTACVQLMWDVSGHTQPSFNLAPSDAGSLLDQLRSGTRTTNNEGMEAMAVLRLMCDGQQDGVVLTLYRRGESAVLCAGDSWHVIGDVANTRRLLEDACRTAEGVVRRP